MRLPGSSVLRRLSGNKFTLDALARKNEEPDIRCSDGDMILHGSIYDLRLMAHESQWLTIRTDRKWRSKLLPESVVLTRDGEKLAADLKVGDSVITNGLRLYRDQEWLTLQHYVKGRSIQEIADECNIPLETIEGNLAKLRYRKVSAHAGKVLPGPVLTRPLSIVDIRKSKTAEPVYSLNVYPAKYLVVGNMLVKVCEPNKKPDAGA